LYIQSVIHTRVRSVKSSIESGYVYQQKEPFPPFRWTFLFDLTKRKQTKNSDLPVNLFLRQVKSVETKERKERKEKKRKETVRLALNSSHFLFVKNAEKFVMTLFGDCRR
jgi:hypothetical protein